MRLFILAIIFFLSFSNQAAGLSSQIDCKGQLLSTLKVLCQNQLKGKTLPISLKTEELGSLTTSQLRFLTIQSYNNPDCQNKASCHLYLEMTFLKNNDEKIAWAYPLEIEMNIKNNSIKRCHCSFENYFVCDH